MLLNRAFAIMRTMNWLIFSIFCFVGSLQAMSKPQQHVKISENIGVRTFQFEDAERSRPVFVELWYPTKQDGPLDNPKNAVWVYPDEVRDGPISDALAKYPLIVMSHGHGGDRRDLSWLVESLTQNGFVVASVEHYGNSWAHYNPLLSLRFWERARDVSFAITQLLGKEGVQERLDANRIGFIGYSLGGMTGLALGGARAHNVKEIVLEQQKHQTDIDLALVETVDFSEAHENFSDTRIKAMLLLSPATFVFPPQSLKQVKIPVALIASVDDEILPHKEHALRIIKHLVPAKLKLLRDKISHYVFLNRVSDQGKGVIRDELKSETVQNHREMIHKEVSVDAVEFFRKNLK